MKIGVMFGNPETTTGGNALKFYASVRLDIRKIASLKEGEEVIGSRTKVKVVKNKVAAPFKQCEFDIMYGTGISREGSLLDLATDMEIVQKSGTWFSYGKERIGQGREKARDFLKENRVMAEEIELKIRQSLASGRADAANANAKPKAASGGDEESWDNIEIAAQGEG
jgi:recombination protein RecA